MPCYHAWTGIFVSVTILIFLFTGKRTAKSGYWKTEHIKKIYFIYWTKAVGFSKQATRPLGMTITKKSRYI